MNSIMRDYYPLFRLYQRLRAQLMGLLSDADLAFTPGGGNAPLGVLCREIGEVEQSYIQSFKTFTLHFDYHNPDPAIERSVQALTDWYAALDAELEAVVAGLSDEDIATRRVVRSPYFSIPPQHQLDIYKEALIVFAGKVSVYLKLMGKELPEQWHEWIG